MLLRISKDDAIIGPFFHFSDEHQNFLSADCHHHPIFSLRHFIFFFLMENSAKSLLSESIFHAVVGVTNGEFHKVLLLLLPSEKVLLLLLR